MPAPQYKRMLVDECTVHSREWGQETTGYTTKGDNTVVSIYQCNNRIKQFGQGEDKGRELDVLKAGDLH